MSPCHHHGTSALSWPVLNWSSLFVSCYICVIIKCWFCHVAPDVFLVLRQYSSSHLLISWFMATIYILDSQFWLYTISPVALRPPILIVFFPLGNAPPPPQPPKNILDLIFAPPIPISVSHNDTWDKRVIASLTAPPRPLSCPSHHSTCPLASKLSSIPSCSSFIFSPLCISFISPSPHPLLPLFNARSCLSFITLQFSVLILNSGYAGGPCLLSPGP